MLSDLALALRYAPILHFDKNETIPVRAVGYTVFKETKQSLLNQKSVIKSNGGTVLQSVIWSEYHQMILWIGSDMTCNEVKAKKLQHMKIEAIDMAQQVINKQMTVAQEIASLLGETTAETKVTLTKLKQLIQEEEAIKQ